ncbi:MAG: SOS response-associated peptidase [Pseudomonadota bacterium]
MCGRLVGGHMTQAQMLAIIEGFLYGTPRIDPDAPPLVEGYNIKPTQQVGMIFDQDGDPVLSTARWWLVPSWHKGSLKDWKATTFNAKIETAREKPTFSRPWQNGRCLIPALGYYEWTGTKGKKQPWYITVERNAPVMFLAGLQSTRPDGLRSCTILTRAADADLTRLHPRMPVILTPEECLSWLQRTEDDASVITKYGTGWSGRFRAHPVQRFGIKDDGPELIEPEGFAV